MNTTIQVRTNKTLKTKAQKVLKGSGLTLTDVVNVAIENIVTDKEALRRVKMMRLKQIYDKEVEEAMKPENRKYYKSAEEMWADMKNW